MSTELAVREHVAAIAASSDPAGAIEFATKTAALLTDVLRRAKLIAPIGRGHVMAEGWTLLGAMTNHSARITWCKRISDPEMGVGWEAHADVLDMNGLVVGGGEAMAMKNEKNAKGGSPTWTENEYSMRGMAQTRAISRALRSKLGFIVSLAGLESTPAEEMPGAESSRDDGGAQPRRGRKPKWETNLEANNQRIAALGFKSQAEVRDFATEHGLSLQAEDFGKDAEVKKWTVALDAREAEIANANGADPLDANTPEQAEAALPGDGEQTTIDAETPIGAPAYGREPS